MRRRSSSLLVLLAGACAGGDGPTPPAATEIVGRFAVVSMGGRSLPVRVTPASSREIGEIIADTVTFTAAGRFEDVVVYHYPAATVPRFTLTRPGSYVRTGERVRLTYDGRWGEYDALLVRGTLTVDVGDPPDVYVEVR